MLKRADGEWRRLCGHTAQPRERAVHVGEAYRERLACKEKCLAD
jgi:hypothetical protein